MIFFGYNRKKYFFLLKIFSHDSKAKLPTSFENNYSNIEFKVISKDNFWEFVI